MSVCGAAARCVECGKGGLPVGVMGSADALEGFEHHFPPAVVIAFQPYQPSGKPLRGKGVAGGGYLCRAWLGAAEGNVPASVAFSSAVSDQSAMRGRTAPRRTA